MNIYFSGIGGFGIGPLAMLAADAGHTVAGSDLAISPVARQLKDRGISVFPQDGAGLSAFHRDHPLDLFVYTSALKADNPELLLADKLGVRAVKRDELINEIISDKKLKLLAVAGTHGKTTTTAMLIWLMDKLRIPVSYSIGTTLSFGPSGQYRPESQYLIYEADEFDRNFLHFRPFISLLTAIDYDHADTYPTIESYRQAFVDFISQSEHTLIWDRDATKLSALNSSVISLDYSSYGHQKRPNALGLDLAGQHNRANATLALELAVRFLGVSQSAAVDTLNQYPGSGRRFERLRHNLYSDYAHHPEEIAATIALAKELNRKVVVVYQPHQNIRQHQLVADNAYRGAFTGAAKVYWLPTYLSREDPALTTLQPRELIASAGGTVFVTAEMNDQLAEHIHQHLENAELVLAMSAGDLDDWLRKEFF